ncbi:hypothetical protein Aduo_008978 [Ancylostoma duodenale]
MFLLGNDDTGKRLSNVSNESTHNLASRQDSVILDDDIDADAEQVNTLRTHCGRWSQKTRKVLRCSNWISTEF